MRALHLLVIVLKIQISRPFIQEWISSSWDYSKRPTKSKSHTTMKIISWNSCGMGVSGKIFFWRNSFKSSAPRWFFHEHLFFQLRVIGILKRNQDGKGSSGLFEFEGHIQKKKKKKGNSWDVWNSFWFQH